MAHNGTVTDTYPPSAPEQHDTAAIPRPYPPAGQGPGYAPGYDPRYTPGYAPGYPPGGYIQGNPAAEAWESKFRSQRTRTRIAVAVAAVTSAAALIMGFATWQLSQNPLLSAASDLASGDLNLEGLLPPTTPDTPQGTTPDTDVPDAPSADGLDIPLSELPLPEGLQSLASTLGITDVGQLLDLAVANGIMSQEDADRLSAGIAAEALANGLAQGQGDQ